tara:strand:- start:1412 stop:1984 length:573 start_codon:yes stop_codon:yes gene_type:complete
VRIIAGKWKSRKLESFFEQKSPPLIRPTTDRVRENIFNIIESLNTGNHLLGAKVLDLFCGTGAMGLEALSRGADFCHFIDNSIQAKRVTLLNIRKLGADENSVFTMANILNLNHNDRTRNDIVFLDPPYGKNLCEKAISMLLKYSWVKETTIFVLEQELKVEGNYGLRIIDQRRYGRTNISILSGLGLKI